MKYERFEDVPVWQDGIDLTVLIFKITEDRSFRYQGDIANQLQRAGLSIPNNVSEGFERGTTGELVTFLYYAKGSAGEVRSICHVIERLERFAHLRSEISDLKSLAESISRQLSAWASSLQNSDIEGPRRLTDASRRTYDQKKRSKAFQERLRKDEEERLKKLKARRSGDQGSGPDN